VSTHDRHDRPARRVPLARRALEAHAGGAKQRLRITSIPRQEDQVILEEYVTLTGSLGRARCRALFDSGASYSIIRPDIAERVVGAAIASRP
jgi:hypothetical protein